MNQASGQWTLEELCRRLDCDAAVAVKRYWQAYEIYGPLGMANWRVISIIIDYAITLHWELGMLRREVH